MEGTRNIECMFISKFRGLKRKTNKDLRWKREGKKTVTDQIKD